VNINAQWNLFNVNDYRTVRIFVFTCLAQFGANPRAIPGRALSLEDSRAPDHRA
jgi:hypothetical protein